MEGPGREQQRQRARHAEALSEEARERAADEREAAARSERSIAIATNPRIRELHRHAADLHRQALQLHADAAALQQLHAEHEFQAAMRADETGTHNAKST
jgi:hypothetical protein